MSELMDQRLANKINALLAKAKSAQEMGTEEGDNEAESYMLMVQKLMVRNNITQQMLRQTQSEPQREQAIVEEDIYIAPGPYRRSRCELASQVAQAMGIRELRLANTGSYIRVCAYPEDIREIQMMFELIEPQMVAAGKRRTTRGEHKTEGMHAKTWLVQYFQSYSLRVNRRITDARVDAAEEVVIAEGYEDETTGQTVGRVTGVLVLASKTEKIRQAYETRYPVKRNQNGELSKRQGPTWKAPKGQSFSWDARQAGRTDGEKARIRHDSKLVARKAVG